MFDGEAQDRLSAFVQERVERNGIPGMALAVVHGDQTVYARGYGVTSADREQAVAVTPNTVFRIGSTTKPLTGTLLMRLVEMGKLSLDEPIVAYLPWFTLSDPEAAPRVTLRHLMSHQSGLPWGAQFFGDRDPGALEAYVRKQVPRMPLIAPPGLLFSYSNAGTNVAGCVAQAVGGAPFAELMQTLVFQPLAMERTTFDPLRAMAFPLAQAHKRTESGITVRRDEPWAENVAYRPSAMAFSTVRDIANFARLHLGCGESEGKRLLSPESVAEMQTTQVDEYQRDGRTVGLNFALTQYRGHRRVSHGGGIASFGSIFTMLPDARIAVVMQFNDDAFWQAGEEIVRHIFDIALEGLPQAIALSGTPDTAPAPDLWRNSPGTYLGPRSGLAALSATSQEGALRLTRPGKPGEAILTPLRPGLYTGRNDDTGQEETVGLIAPQGGLVTHLMLNGAPCARIEPNPNFKAVPETWSIYTGSYQGPDVTFPSGVDVLRIRCEGDRLKVRSRNRAREEDAVPWDEGCFIYREQLLRFQTPSSFTLGDTPAPYRRMDQQAAEASGMP